MPPEALEALPSQCYYPLLSDGRLLCYRKREETPHAAEHIVVPPKVKPRHLNRQCFRALSSVCHSDGEEEKDLEIKRWTARS